MTGRTGLPAAEVLADAVAVLRDHTDAATPGHRSYELDFGAAYAGDEQVGALDSEGDGMFWAAFGPDEARLLADLLERLDDAWPHGYPPADAVALDLAYKLTGHQRHDEETG